MANDFEEDRLRHLLHDDGWSLRAWPDAEQRVRRTAKRQRLATAGATMTACVLAAAAVVLPLRLLGPASPHAGGGSRPAAHSSASSPTPQPIYTLPAVGMPGYPTSVYPPPRPTPPSFNPPPYCPSGTNVQPFGAVAAERALLTLRILGRSFDGDLQVSDRAFWTMIAAEWQSGGTKLLFTDPKRSIVYAGPLVNYSSIKGPSDLDGVISVDCGAWLALSTWLVVTGPPRSPAQQSELLFINRAGHVLLYYAQ